MFYYKTDDEIFASPALLPFNQITEEEYNSILQEIELAREAMDKELEQKQIESLLAGDTVVIR